LQGLVARAGMVQSVYGAIALFVHQLLLGKLHLLAMPGLMLTHLGKLASAAMLLGRSPVVADLPYECSQFACARPAYPSTF